MGVGAACAGEIALDPQSTSEPKRLADLKEDLYQDRDFPLGYVAEFIGASEGSSGQAFRGRATQRCMVDRGLAYTPDEVAGLNPDRFNREARRKYGYGITIELPDFSLEISENEKHLKNASADELENWSNSYNECRDSAVRAQELLLDAAFEKLDSRLQDEIQQVPMLGHPQLRPAVQAWSECMDEQGWILVHPIQTLEVLRDIPTDQDPSAIERKLSVADLDCSSETLTPALDSLIADLEHRAQLGSEERSIYGNS